MSNDTILILGGTGKTGRRIASLLRESGAPVRTAARSGADIAFDWEDTATHAAALAGVRAIYLVPPGLRLDYGADVLAFVDRAVAAGVEHVTFLSARGVADAPDEAAAKVVEHGLAARDGLSWSVLRPGWFMQNFSEAFFTPGTFAPGEIHAPAGNGREAFIHADDIADAAVATLLDPAAHDGETYPLSGPEALSFAEAAEQLGATYVDVTPDRWQEELLSVGVTPEYADMLGFLMTVLAQSAHAEPTDGVLRATGHEPRSFAAYAATLAAPVS